MAANSENTNTYGYDSLDRLTGAGLPGTPFAYSYDAVGNRLSKTVRLMQATSLIGVTRYQVNALGQRTERQIARTTRSSTTTHGPLIAESDSAERFKREILYLGDIPIGVVQ